MYNLTYESLVPWPTGFSVIEKAVSFHRAYQPGHNNRQLDMLMKRI